MRPHLELLPRLLMDVGRTKDGVLVDPRRKRESGPETVAPAFWTVCTIPLALSSIRRTSKPLSLTRILSFMRILQRSLARVPRRPYPGGLVGLSASPRGLWNPAHRRTKTPKGDLEPKATISQAAVSAHSSPGADDCEHKAAEQTHKPLGGFRLTRTYAMNVGDLSGSDRVAALADGELEVPFPWRWGRSARR